MYTYVYIWTYTLALLGDLSEGPWPGPSSGQMPSTMHNQYSLYENNKALLDGLSEGPVSGTGPWLCWMSVKQTCGLTTRGLRTQVQEPFSANKNSYDLSQCDHNLGETM